MRGNTMHEAQTLAFQFKGSPAQRLVLVKLAGDLAKGLASTSVEELKRTWPAATTFFMLPALFELQDAGIVTRPHMGSDCTLNLEALRQAVAVRAAGGAP